MNGPRSSIILLVTGILVPFLACQVTVCEAQVEPQQVAEPADAAEASDAAGAPRPASDVSAIQQFEQKLDAVAGKAVSAIASVLFYEFVGRRSYSEELTETSLSSPQLAALIEDVRDSLSDEQKKQAVWTMAFVREKLSESDRNLFDAELNKVTTTVTSLMENAKSNINLPEADYSFVLSEDDMTQNEADVLTDLLRSEFSSSPLRGMNVSLRELSDGQAREFSAVNSGIPFIVAWLVAGAVFFTLRMGFISLRGFTHAIRVTAGKYDDPDNEGEVSHFQALTAALSATVGLGNIAGVAIAVGIGGPGATFWMIIAGFLGMSSKFTECTLGQMYRQVRPDGRIMGGAMFYLSHGLREMGLARLGKFLGVLFAVMCVLASFGGGNAFQVNQSINAVQSAFPDLTLLQSTSGRFAIGMIMAVLVAIVIIGGIKRIASTAEKIVPLMCGVYVLACLYILVINAGAVPAALSLIVQSAFTPAAGYGAIMGVLVQGFRRAAFSNEAGVGSAAIAHSAARTEYPVREGIVALLEPFIDTVVVCTMTALVIVITGAYDTSHPEYGDLITSRNGAGLTIQAVRSQISWFPYVLAVAVMLFAYSTMISWSYYGERCWSYLFGDRSSLVYKVIFVIFVVLGSVMSATNVLDLSDLMILGMAFPNILGATLLSGKVRRALSEYWQKLRNGDFDGPIENRTAG